MAKNVFTKTTTVQVLQTSQQDRRDRAKRLVRPIRNMIIRLKSSSKVLEDVVNLIQWLLKNIWMDEQTLWI